MTSNLISTDSFSKKKIEELLIKYPNRIPIVLSSISYKKIGNIKLIVPFDMTLTQFITILRNKIELKKEEAIYFFVKDTNNKSDVIIPTTSSLGPLYNQYKDKSLILNMYFEKEAVFG
jgi:hypothetical protein